MQTINQGKLNTKPLLFLLLAAFALQSCSTKRNTIVSRTYHSVTAQFNVYFNGNESYKKGIKRLNSSLKDDYAVLLPVFPFPNTESAGAPEMERAIKKSAKTISLHSITSKPNYKKGIKNQRQREFYNKREYNKWIDDAYMLMGKSSFIKNDMYAANGALRFIIKEYPKENTFIEAQLWLCRKLILEGEFLESGEILEDLSKKKKFPRKHVAFLNAVYADYHIRRNEIPQAIEKLEIAAKKAGGKQLRLRYTYILGQLYQKEGQMKKATEKFNKVIKMSPPYEMAFSARINLANTFTTGGSNANAIRQNLHKLLKDEKNKEYRDQIYFALANLDLKEGKKDEAIENFRLSAQLSVENQRQKARSYLAIADIKYSDRDYLAAQAFYDSTITNIDETFPDFATISAKARSLTKLSSNLNMVSLQDSVQFIAKMSENERNMFIDQIIAKVKQKEAEDKMREQLEMAEQQSNYMMATEMQNRGGSMAKSMDGNKWYFYSPSARSYGVGEFQMKWGKRKLEDNWRRKNKRATSDSEAFEEEGTEEDGEEDKKKGLDNKSRDYYMVDIPLSDSAMDASHEKIRKGLFNAGTLYKDELNEYRLSARQFEEITKRYPAHPISADAAYQLFILYRQIENTAKADEAKNFLLSKHPESIYAKLLTNPNLAKELEEKEKIVSNLYEQAYEQYGSGNFNSAFTIVSNAMRSHPEHKLLPKFKLLSAMVQGQIFGPDSLRANLDQLIKTWPKTEEASLAADIIALIDEDRPEIKEKAEEIIAKEIYSVPADSEKHYYVAVLAQRRGNHNQMVFNLINYNLDNYMSANLNSKSEALTNGNQIVVVSSFQSKQEALNYFDNVRTNETVLKDVGSVLASFIISETNLSVFKNDGSESRYVKFFNSTYQR